ncbi:hypothetical protein LVD15_18385 [Fulvivirga maritima]|uniref:hypothetical protein n=1 Tax=Fulvivirga maritima TaxID=2904247 RepID=UPI001F17CB10|nr:hypothetical protein [Fulvivirga maritima]UII25262.1 hypothetical protein LVD15_18385 [Fulvivirga maritima]
MKSLYPYILGAVFITMACSSPKEKATEQVPESDTFDLHEAMLGEWRNESLEVTVEGPERDSIIKVPVGKWEEVFQIKPVRTTFNSDSTFTSEYRSLEDSGIMVNNGVWYIEDDSLVYINRGKKFKYQVELEGDEAIFKGYVDWDDDGEVDDFYNGKQKKQ